MTSPVRTPDTRPAPTVRPPRSRPAARLVQASLWPLIIGVFGGVIGLLLHHSGAAVAIAAPFCGLSGVLALAAAVVAARQLRFNPWAAVMTAGLVVVLAVWVMLPVIGLAWARIPLAAGVIGAGWHGLRAFVRHRRRNAAYHRWAQALSHPLAQGHSQVEQVLAGLAGTARAERVTAPHFGAAPNAAWSLQVVRWSGENVRIAKLKLPAHDDITSPDFLIKIREALIRRAGVENLQLQVNPQLDEITITVLNGPEEEEEEPEQDRQAQAIAAAEQAAGDWLKGVKVRVLHWQDADPEEPAGAGPAWLLERFVVTFDHNARLTLPANQEQLRFHMSMQLYNDSAMLRADWNLPQNRVVFRKRASFPAIIPFHPVDTRPLFGDLVVIIYGITEDGTVAFIQLSETDAPHILVTGGTGTGKSVLLRVAALGAARLGIDVRGCDPKRVEMRGWRGWPNITEVATRVQDMIKLIEDTYDEMHDRYADIEEGKAREEDYRRVLLIIDEFLMFGMLVNDYWAEERARRPGNQPREHPVMRKIRGLVVMARGGVMNLLLATQRGDADIFPEGVRDSIGARIAMGRQSPQSAQMMFGDAQAGRDVPQGARGVGTTLTPDGPARIKVGWLPDPAKWNDPKQPLGDEDRQLLLDMLPPGAQWDGPLPFQAPDPGFEDTSPDSEAAAGKPHVRLLYLARAAMLTRAAHLTDGTTGGAPADGDLAAHYGWYPGADRVPRPSGTWIGCAAGDSGGRRAYLYPERVLEVARDMAANMGVPFPFDQVRVTAALRDAGLLNVDTDGESRRYVVLRPVPGNDLPGKDRRQRVWDIPEDELIGDVLTDHQDPGPKLEDTLPALPSSSAPDEPSAPSPAAALPAANPAPVFRNAGKLEEGQQVVLNFTDGQALTATVYSLDPDPTTRHRPEPDGTPRLVLNYIGDNGEPGFVRVRSDHPIRLASPDGSTGGNQP
jgi:hypothetical protein